MELREPLRRAILEAAVRIDPAAANVEVIIQETPEDLPGDYGTPVAFALARLLRRSPLEIADQLAATIQLPPRFVRVEASKAYLNFFVDPASFLIGVLYDPLKFEETGHRVIVEHSSVNPNKELHVGHLRNVVLGDTMARLGRWLGYRIEVQNYIDDTGRQAAEALFAAAHFGLPRDDSKYDHWLGELYVYLHQELANPERRSELEPGIRAVMHQLEAGERRSEIEQVVRAQLQTCADLGADYDLLVWESDIVSGGLLRRSLELLQASPRCHFAAEGKYAGCLVLETEQVLPGLEDPTLVLVRSDGTATYIAKDIALQFWKFGLLDGFRYQIFGEQPSGRPLYTTAPQGEPAGFGHAAEVINVVDDRQSYPQAVVRAALELVGYPMEAAQSHHLAYGPVLLEGQTISGRKGITISIDEVIEEAVRRAGELLSSKRLANPDHLARQIGIGALRFSMLRAEPARRVDFRWDSALSLQGDAAPYLQYAAVRAAAVIRRAEEAGLSIYNAEFLLLGEAEVTVAKVINRLADIAMAAWRERAPHLLAQYALDLANSFNIYYNHRDPYGIPDTRVLATVGGQGEARLELIKKVHTTLSEVLSLLGIEVPQEM
jgi:arginyl-tRNA synthetase